MDMSFHWKFLFAIVINLTAVWAFHQEFHSHHGAPADSKFMRLFNPSPERLTPRQRILMDLMNQRRMQNRPSFTSRSMANTMSHRRSKLQNNCECCPPCSSEPTTTPEITTLPPPTPVTDPIDPPTNTPPLPCAPCPLSPSEDMNASLTHLSAIVTEGIRRCQIEKDSTVCGNLMLAASLLPEYMKQFNDFSRSFSQNH